MRFEVDYARAKTMATRLQEFISENPKPKLTRSSSIEAVARMLGFANRNTMAAQIDDGAGEVATSAPAPSAADAIQTAFEQERQTCAKALVEVGRDLLPHGSFKEAMHAEGPEGDHTLIIVEEAIARGLEASTKRLRILNAALFTSSEYESAQDVRNDIASICAYALVNKSMDLAEELWSELSDTPQGEVYDTLELAYQQGAADLERAIRDGIEPEGHLQSIAESIAAQFNNPIQDVSRNILGQFIADFGMNPAAYFEADQKKPWLTWEVEVSCWVPGSLLAELPDNRVAEIDARVPAKAVIEIDASDAEDALSRAQELLDAGVDLEIWTPRPDLGVINKNSTSQALDAGLVEYVRREEHLVEDHWEFDFSRADTFRAEKIIE